MTVTPMPSATAPDAPSGFIDRRAKGEYLRLSVGCFLVSFTTAHTSLLAIVFARDGYDLHAVGLLLSLVAIPIIGMALLSGEVMARLGALATLRLAMTLALVGFGSLLMTRSSFGAALASRLIQGVGQGLFLAAAYTYAQSRLDPTRFLFLLGIFSAAMPLAQGIAPPIGGFVLERWGEPAFFLVALAPGVAGLLMTFGPRPLPPPERKGGLAIASALRPGVWEPLLCGWMNGTMMGFCGAYLAAALVARNIPLTAFFTASLTTMFATRLLALRGIEAVNRRLLVGSGLGLMALGLSAVAVSGTIVWPVIAGGVSFGFGYSLTYPVISAWISSGQDARDRAGSQALLNAAFSFGLFAMPLPETWLIAWLGYEGTLLVLAAAGLATTGILISRLGRPSAFMSGSTEPS